MVYAYGEESRIRVAGTGGLLSFDPGIAALPLMLQRMIPEMPGHGKP
jgi:hypothetical protein